MPRLFVDMDGVLADFDTHYKTHFGVVLDRNGPEPKDLWANIKTRPAWYDELPVLPGAVEFFDKLRPYKPTVLSGISTKVPGCALHKRAWLDRVLGPDVPLITCKSKDKRLHGSPGDILIDDWKKYRSLWETMGGTFILHDSTTPDVSVDAVKTLLGDPS